VTWEELSRADKEIYRRQSDIDKARSAAKQIEKDSISGRRHKGEFVSDVTEEEMDEINGRSFEGTAHDPEDETREFPTKIQRLSQAASSSSTENPRQGHEDEDGEEDNGRGVEDHVEGAITHFELPASGQPEGEEGEVRENITAPNPQGEQGSPSVIRMDTTREPSSSSEHPT
jgi:hypothetical protein